VWSLHVLPVCAWVLSGYSGYSGFLPPSKNMHEAGIENGWMDGSCARVKADMVTVKSIQLGGRMNKKQLHS